MKSILYSQIKGRRKGDTEVRYKFDWWKLVAAALLGALITWGSWVTRMASKAENTEDYVDMQVGVLHDRITSVQMNHEKDETRMEDQFMNFQQRFYEDEIADCEEDRDGQTNSGDCVQAPGTGCDSHSNLQGLGGEAGGIESDCSD